MVVSRHHRGDVVISNEVDLRSFGKRGQKPLTNRSQIRLPTKRAEVESRQLLSSCVLVKMENHASGIGRQLKYFRRGQEQNLTSGWLFFDKCLGNAPCYVILPILCTVR